MKKVIFNTLQIQNYLSIGNDPVRVNFSPKTINLVTGQNLDKIDRNNGTGKSSIPDALFFALFGEPLRKIKRDTIANNVTKQPTVVQLEFDVYTKSKHSYKIIRHLQPSKVELYIDGVEETLDTIGNTNAKICEIISGTPQIFKNCVILDINNIIPFMAKDKTDKRKFIEEIFGLEIFAMMASHVRSDILAISNEFSTVYKQLENEKSYNSKLIETRKSILDDRIVKRTTYEQRKQSNTAEKQQLITEIQQGKAKVGDVEELKVQQQKLSDVLIQLRKKLQDANKKHGEYFSQKNLFVDHKNNVSTNKICPMCSQQIPQNHESHESAEYVDDKIRACDELIAEINPIIDALCEKLKTVQAAHDTVTNKIRSNDLYKAELANNIKRLQQINKWMETLDSDIEECNSTTTEYDSKISDSDITIEILSQKVSEVSKQQGILESAKYLLSEEGIKSFIISKILNILNAKLLGYLQRLDANCICYFNEYFDDEIVNHNNHICTYFNFSGAERKAIDFACMFTFIDMRFIQSSVTYNVMFYDELFDSSIDEKGLDLIMDVVKQRCELNDESVYLISHRKETAKHVTGEIIQLEKKNGITKRVDIMS